MKKETAKKIRDLKKEAKKQGVDAPQWMFTQAVQYPKWNERRPQPKYPPNLTNHQRHRMRQEERKEIANQRRAVTEATLKDDF